MSMRVLIVGSGAREHALGLRLHQDGAHIIAAPGNVGLAGFGLCYDVAVDDILPMTQLALTEKVDLVVIGPEVPLALGLADSLRDAGVAVFGPGTKSAKLESSKSVAKAFMARHNIPTARFVSTSDPKQAKAFIDKLGGASVIKADGLAAGKGVVVAESAAEAYAAVEHMLRDKAFAEAGDTIVVEELLEGEEISVHVLTDGKAYQVLAVAQDHKRALDEDKGLNTGGMGAYSPAPQISDAVMAAIVSDVIEPTIAGFQKDANPTGNECDFKGVVFIGIMVRAGKPWVLEYNVRFGDPETEVLVARMGKGLLGVLKACADAKLAEAKPVELKHEAAMCVMLTSKNYPLAYEKGKVITGIEAANAIEGVQVYVAGCKEKSGELVTSGGRVLAVTARASTLKEAQTLAYQGAACINFEGKTMRTDIGWRALEWIENKKL